MTDTRQLLTIDCETDPFRHERFPVDFVWGAHDGLRFRSWWEDREGFAAWLGAQHALAYAHNGGRFDVWHLIPFINRDRPVIIIDGRIASCFIGDTELRDSFLVFPEPLASYKKAEIDYDVMERDSRDQHRDEIETYLEADCWYLHELLQVFFEQNPGRPLTLAQAAMRSWARMAHMDPPHITEGMDSTFRMFYFGGRVQSLKIGIHDGPWRMADIRSAYPHVMTMTHPWGKHYWEGRSLPGGKWALRRSFATIEARSWGALPIREPSGRLRFPADGVPRTYHATGWEIEAGRATQTLQVVSVERCLVCEDRIDFKPYVKHWFQRKQAADESGDLAGRLVAKRMMNALSGKWGQDPSHHMTYEWHPDDRNLPLDGRAYYRLGHDYLVGYPAARQTRYHVAVIASITGAVRARLWRDLCQSTDPAYCDTDCIIGRELDHLEFGDQLGQWTDEGTFAKAAFAGRKLYALFHPDGSCGHYASKGVRLSPAEIHRIAGGKTVEWKAEAPTYSLSRGPHFITRQVKRREAD